jgi:hypothetical protein
MAISHDPSTRYDGAEWQEFNTAMSRVYKAVLVEEVLLVPGRSTYPAIGIVANLLLHRIPVALLTAEPRHLNTTAQGRVLIEFVDLVRSELTTHLAKDQSGTVPELFSYFYFLVNGGRAVVPAANVHRMQFPDAVPNNRDESPVRIFATASNDGWIRVTPCKS